MTAELHELRESATRNGDFIAALQRTSTSPKQLSDTARAETWTLGDMESLRAVIHALSQLLASADNSQRDTEKEIQALQSTQLKAEVKREEVARFLRARQDAGFAKMVRVRNLGPEHLENQRRLRHATHGVRERMQELEEQLASMKSAVHQSMSGRPKLSVPSLDSVYRSAENISRLAASRVAELSEMSTKLACLCPVHEQGTEPVAKLRREPLHDLGALGDVLPTIGNDAAEDRTAPLQASRHGLMEALLDARTEPLTTVASSEAPRTVATRAQRASGQAPCSMAQGTAQNARPHSPRLRPAPAAPAAEVSAADARTSETPETTTARALLQPNFLVTSTPDGAADATARAKPGDGERSAASILSSPTASIKQEDRRPRPVSVFSGLGTNNGMLNKSSPLMRPQYTTFEGLVPPQKVATATDLTLEEFVAQQDSEDDADDDDYDEDYGEEEEDDFGDEGEDEEDEEGEDDGEEGEEEGEDDGEEGEEDDGERGGADEEERKEGDAVENLAEREQGEAKEGRV
ncbi:hypothetical protein MSPP1_001952 [Malassezia sp. CBS 17886]|nr:hypothetical protein MSPP1_001952 [Malassezia sp. CBS 17886]